MQAASPMARTGFKFMLTVRDGPDVGATFQLLPPQVSIGRGADCHVILNDPRVSRNAAVIEFSMEQIKITEVSNRQIMQVNEEFVVEASIKDGDIIRIGDTEMTFFVEALPLVPGRPLSPAGQYVTVHGPRGMTRGPLPQGAPSSGGLSKRQRFYLVGGAIVAVIIWLGVSEQVAKGPKLRPRTVEELEKEIKTSEEKQTELLKTRVFKNDDEKTRYLEAQRHFNEGFRDFQKGQWVRAMRSFETAATIDTQHQLARRYYKLSEKERDAMIASLTLEGRRYREKGMWTRCSAQFEKVLDMIPNKEDVKYKSADALKKECDLQLQPFVDGKPK